MYSRVLSSCLYGLSGDLTWVEVDVENGLPNFSIVGLANQSIKEAKERIRSAVKNCGFKFPDKRITVNLTPANKKKEGSHFDLPIAIGLLISEGGMEIKGDIRRTAFLGELTLDGRIDPAEGVLPMIIGLQAKGIERVVIPIKNLSEACLVKGMEIVPAESLSQVVDFLTGFTDIEVITAEGFKPSDSCIDAPDFADIKGQAFVKRAAQVAAAGGHGLLMIGSPGVGKSMVGKRIPGILPPLTYEEQLDVTQIYSVAGLLTGDMPMITTRPWRAPHHNMSAAALTGGGTKPRPGEISLSHCGVLFLDELPEFSSHVLETLRQPLEDGCVTISRANGHITYPSRFMLTAAMNPCKCGYFGDPLKQCTCTETDRKKYMGRISGPLLDRIDMHVAMERIVYEDIAETAASQEGNITSAQLREGVIKAAEIQKERYKRLKILSNSQLSPAQIQKFCKAERNASALLEQAFSRFNLSARSYHRILKVARTAADLEGSDIIRETHMLEALSYRMPEKFFG
ncbi:MAG: YifB family Mg chelatase-like AAA ATPase [Clostridia bacterium]|nr:YifB family Mg chelatase-like AAA ATPase [Clostridia bacterium]